MATASKNSKSKAKAKAKTKIRKLSKLPKRKKASAKKTATKKSKATKATKKKTAKKVAKKATKKTTAKKPVAKKSAPKAANRKVVSIEPKATPNLPAAPQLQIGDAAPGFTLTNQNGEQVNLGQYLGRRVVLYFYPKDDTPGCTVEACSFRDNLPRFDGINAVVLGVSFDDQASHQKFIEKYGLNFQLLSDLDKSVAKAYGVYVEKNMYGNKTWGIERSTFLIDSQGKIAQIFRKVKVEGHTEEVLAALHTVN